MLDTIREQFLLAIIKGEHNNNKSEQSHLYTSQNADKVSIEVLSGDASITIIGNVKTMKNLITKFMDKDIIILLAVVILVAAVIIIINIPKNKAKKIL